MSGLDILQRLDFKWMAS